MRRATIAAAAAWTLSCSERARTPATAEETSGASSVATFARMGVDSSGVKQGFDLCEIALFGSLDVLGMDRAGALDGDGVQEIIVLGRKFGVRCSVFGEAQVNVQVIDATPAQPDGGWLQERVVQEIRIGEGASSPTRGRSRASAT